MRHGGPAPRGPPASRVTAGRTMPTLRPTTTLRPLAVLLLAAVLALSACSSAKERAARHYQAGVALLQKGDVARAMLEFRAVFRSDATHHDARLAYADLLRRQGNLPEAYAQYRLLVDQYPQDLAGLRALAELSLARGDLPGARAQADGALAVAPDDPGARAVQVALAYRDALNAVDPKAAAAAAAQAAAILATDPGALPARRVVIDDRLRAQDWDGALAAADAGLALTPADRDLAQARLAVLLHRGDAAAIAAELRAMIARFPQDASLPQTLVRWELARHDPDAAEAFLRSRIDPATADPAPRLALIDFLAAVRGRDAAAAEVAAILAAPAPVDKMPFRLLQAGFRFDAGDRAGAVAELQAILKDAPPGPATEAGQVALARMLDARGDRAGAQALVDAVLAADPWRLDAVVLKAGWLTDADQTDAALVLLRAALGQYPDDAGLMTAMARAYARAGAPELEGEMLARAAEAAGQAPEAAARYARFLIAAGRPQAAAQALSAGLAVTPDDLALLALRGAAALAQGDPAAATADADRLAALATPAAQAAADSLRAQALAAQDRGADLKRLLDTIATGRGPGAAAAGIALVQADVAAGDLAAARARVEALSAAAPDDPGVAATHAAVLAALGRAPEARALLDAFLARTPAAPEAWIALYRITAGAQGPAAAAAVLARARAALPQDPTLLWAEGGAREAAGDTEGAIAAYETLYARMGDDPVIANNLASLLASARSDDASLARAALIARRLQGLPGPAIQDTTGWIAFRQGDAAAALAALTPAAAGLPQDAAVQYHLGRAAEAEGRRDTARAAYDRAAALLAANATAPAPAWAADLDARRAALTPAATPPASPAPAPAPAD